MTLQKLLYEIAQLAIAQKAVNYTAAGADINTLNTGTIDSWPVLFTSPTGSHTVTDNTTKYTITLYYLERLLNDNSNDVDIMSVAIEQLKNITNGIKEIDGVVGIDDNYNITNFIETEAFNDRCAGAYCTIYVTVINDTICYVE